MKLIDGFQSLAAAPNGVARLRKLILTLAVRGRLTAQSESDEPASALLQKIQVERIKLGGKRNLRGSETSTTANTNSLCELPSGWEWASLGQLGSFAGGKTPSTTRSEYWGGEMPWVTPKDMKSFDINDSQDYVTERATDDGLGIIPANSVLLVVRSGILRRMVPVAINLRACTVNQDLKALTPYLPEMAPYIRMVIRGFEDYILQQLTKIGTTVESIRFEDFERQPFPIPPLDEQARIVAKVDELMRLCDELESRGRLEAKQHAQLTATLFDALAASESSHALAENWARVAAHFDLLLDRPEAVDALEQTILQLAVRGALVPQVAGDEPTVALLARLRIEREQWLQSRAGSDPECRTALKKLAELPAPDSPFQIPETWAFVRLLDCSRLLVDCHNKTAPYTPSGIPIIRTTNVRDGRFRFDDLRFVTRETYEFWSRRCPPEPGDIIFTREAPMGEAAVIPEGAIFCLGQRTMLIRPMHGYVNTEYLLLALTEPHLLERATPSAIGSTVKHLRVGDVERLSIPLPPVAEQARIVGRVEELRRLCADLRERLTARQTCQAHLAEVLVEQAASSAPLAEHTADLAAAA